MLETVEIRHPAFANVRMQIPASSVEDWVAQGWLAPGGDYFAQAVADDDAER